MATLAWIKENTAVLQLLVIIIGGGLGLWKYWHEQNEARRIAAREMAIDQIVVNGFLIAASEMESAGQQVVFAWLSVENLRSHKDPQSDFAEWRKGLLENGECKRLLYGNDTRFAAATARIRMIHGALYDAIASSYSELCYRMRELALESPDTPFRADPVSVVFLATNYYRFAGGVATKAAQILTDDAHLTLSTKDVLKDKRLTALIDLCEKYKQKHTAYVEACRTQADLNLKFQKLKELNDWMAQAIDGKDGLNSI
jgi:hypothetical protein